jgi:hypothetical protein
MWAQDALHLSSLLSCLCGQCFWTVEAFVVLFDRAALCREGQVMVESAGARIDVNDQASDKFALLRLRTPAL